MGRPEDKYVKLPAIIHATRIGYRYRSIKGDVSGIDYDADTNIFFEPFCAALERINGKSVDVDKAHQPGKPVEAQALGQRLGLHVLRLPSVECGGLPPYRLRKPR